MSQSVSLAGTSHSLPTSNDVDWGSALAAYLAALPTKLGPAVLTFGAASTPASGTAVYLRPGFSDAEANADEVLLRVPFAGKLSKMYIQALVGATGDSVVITARVNAQNTSITATLAAEATDGADTTHSATVAAGDAVSIKLDGGASVSAGMENVVVTLFYSADA